MKLRNVLHHAFNAAAAFTGAVGVAICTPLLALSLMGFPNGPSTSDPAENLTYAIGAGTSAALFAAGYRRSILKNRAPQ
jgi:hypothetical protein